VVLEAQESRRRSLAAAKVSGGEDRDAGGRSSEQDEKETRQCVAPHVKREVGQSNRERRVFRRRRKCHASHHRQRRATQGSQWKQRPPDKTDAHRAQETREPDKNPDSNERQAN
jgi:hypothetical protein